MLNTYITEYAEKEMPCYPDRFQKAFEEFMQSTDDNLLKDEITSLIHMAYKTGFIEGIKFGDFEGYFF